MYSMSKVVQDQIKLWASIRNYIIQLIIEYKVICDVQINVVSNNISYYIKYMYTKKPVSLYMVDFYIGDIQYYKSHNKLNIAHQHEDTALDSPLGKLLFKNIVPSEIDILFILNDSNRDKVLNVTIPNIVNFFTDNGCTQLEKPYHFIVKKNDMNKTTVCFEMTDKLNKLRNISTKILYQNIPTIVPKIANHEPRLIDEINSYLNPKERLKLADIPKPKSGKAKRPIDNNPNSIGNPNSIKKSKAGSSSSSSSTKSTKSQKHNDMSDVD